MDVTFNAGGGGAVCASLPHFLLLAGCNADMVAGALAAVLHHKVEVMFETGDTIKQKESEFLMVTKPP